MTERITLMAEPRTALGKKNKALRREGKTPGVVYGPYFKETRQVQVDQKELERLYMNYGLETPLTLRVGTESVRVVIREVQMNNLKRAPVHVDFYVPKR